MLGSLGLATGFVPIPGFWSSYVLDIVGPAWNYILIRGLFTQSRSSILPRHRTPEIVFIFILALCFMIEAAQYLNLYEAHFDPYDFLAYISFLIPCYMIDRWLLYQRAKRANFGG